MSIPVVQDVHVAGAVVNEAWAKPLERANIPGPIQEAARAAVIRGVAWEAGRPRVSVSALAKALKGPPGRHLREAWKAGERDLGRLTYLVGRYVLGLDEPHAWTTVVDAGLLYPGRVEPSFLAQAATASGQPGVLARYGQGAPEEPEPFAEKYVPWILGGVVIAMVAILANPPWKKKE